MSDNRTPEKLFVDMFKALLLSDEDKTVAIEPVETRVSKELIFTEINYDPIDLIELDERKQQKKESVKKYIFSKLRLIFLKYPLMNEFDICVNLIKGLEPTLRQMVDMRAYKKSHYTLNELFRIIIECIDQLGLCPQPNENDSSMNSNAEKFKEFDEDLANLRIQIAELKSILLNSNRNEKFQFYEQTEKENKLQRTRCVNCGAFGHHTTNCRN